MSKFRKLFGFIVATLPTIFALSFMTYAGSYCLNASNVLESGFRWADLSLIDMVFEVSGGIAFVLIFIGALSLAVFVGRNIYWEITDG